MNEAVQLINEVGFPIAAAGGLGFFIWKLINRIIDGMESKIAVSYTHLTLPTTCTV